MGSAGTETDGDEGGQQKGEHCSGWFVRHRIALLQHPGTEIRSVTGQDALDNSTQQEVIEVTKQLVQMIEKSSSIVDFFNRESEIKRVKRDVRRTLIQSSFGDRGLIGTITDEFIELARGKFE